MHKITNILLAYGNAVLDLPRTNDPIGKPLDQAEGLIREMLLELIGEDEPFEIDDYKGRPIDARNALRAELRQKVSEL